MSVREHNRKYPLMGRTGVTRMFLADESDHLPVGKIGQQKLPPPLSGDFAALELSGVKLGYFHEEGLRFGRRNFWVMGCVRVVETSVRHFCAESGPQACGWK